MSGTDRPHVRRCCRTCAYPLSTMRITTCPECGLQGRALRTPVWAWHYVRWSGAARCIVRLWLPLAAVTSVTGAMFMLVEHSSPVTEPWLKPVPGIAILTVSILASIVHFLHWICWHASLEAIGRRRMHASRRRRQLCRIIICAWVALLGLSCTGVSAWARLRLSASSLLAASDPQGRAVTLPGWCGLYYVYRTETIAGGTWFVLTPPGDPDVSGIVASRDEVAVEEVFRAGERWRVIDGMWFVSWYD